MTKGFLIKGITYYCFEGLRNKLIKDFWRNRAVFEIDQYYTILLLFQRRNNYFCFITIKERNFFMMCNFITHQIFCTLSFTRKNKLLILIELDRILKSSDGPKPKNFDFWVLKNHQLLSNSQKQSICNCLPDLGGKSACLLSRVLVDHAKKFSVLQKEELQQL